jgi:sugar phosphate isomerase/epimerase
VGASGIDFVLWPACVQTYAFPQQIAAAAAGGFTHLAVSPYTYKQTIAAGITPRTMKAIAADAGVVLGPLDTVTGWAPVRVPAGAEALADRLDFTLSECFAICEALELTTVTAIGGFALNQVPQDALLDGFCKLCDLAAARGIWVDLEFMPLFGLPDLAAAWEIVSRAARPNAGILVDTWHFLKGNANWELLRAIPGELFVNVQVADALARPLGSSLREDCGRYRRFPGEGELALCEVLTILRDKGRLKSIGPEIFSDEINALAPDEAGRRAAATTRRVAAQAGISVLDVTLPRAFK